MNRKISTLLSVGISIALIAGAIWFLFYHQNSFGYGNGQWIMPHHMTIGGGGMGIIMILFWVAVIAVTAIVISGILSGRSDRPSWVRPSNRNQSDALEILKARYAKGEIDKAQYQSMKQELQQHE
jgi:putative membrane protein